MLQVMKTYHMYHTESLSAESKLKEAEKQEEKHIGKANDISSGLLRYGHHDERPQRRSSVKKMEKMKEKVCWVDWFTHDILSVVYNCITGSALTLKYK